MHAAAPAQDVTRAIVDENGPWRCTDRHDRDQNWDLGYGIRVIRLAGPGATGELAPMYATSASTSKPGAVTRFVPPVRSVKPSPPLARKSLVVTR